MHLTMIKFWKTWSYSSNSRPRPPPAAFNTFFVCKNANAADNDIQGGTWDFQKKIDSLQYHEYNVSRPVAEDEDGDTLQNDITTFGILSSCTFCCPISKT